MLLEHKAVIRLQYHISASRGIINITLISRRARLTVGSLRFGIDVDYQCMKWRGTSRNRGIFSEARIIATACLTSHTARIQQSKQG